MQHTRGELAAFVESSDLPMMAKAPATILLRSLTDEQIAPLLIPFGIVMDAIAAEQVGDHLAAQQKCAELGTLLYQVIQAYAAPKKT